jgi:hypothetical protein
MNERRVLAVGRREGIKSFRESKLRVVTGERQSALDGDS